MLTPAQVERLGLLAEEAAEVIHVIGKILRHGFEAYDPTHPDIENAPTNQVLLGYELGDMEYAIQLLTQARELSLLDIEEGRLRATRKKPQYLHHQGT